MTTAALEPFAETRLGTGCQPAFLGIPAIVDGSEAVAHVETRVAEGCCAYPITPSTTMAAIFQSAVADGRTNLWATPLGFLEPESEHSSASAAEGFALAGGLHGRPERRKELSRILVAHGEVYVAQSTTAHINHFYRAIMEANTYPGPAVVIVYTPCQPEHGIPDDAGMRQAKLAVESRAFPLLTYDPRRGAALAERLSLQGNPALREDWAKGPDGTAVDFLSFARTEGRFAPHFGVDGMPSPEIAATRDERLANWRSLQELAGLRR